MTPTPSTNRRARALGAAAAIALGAALITVPLAQTSTGASTFAAGEHVKVLASGEAVVVDHVLDATHVVVASDTSGAPLRSYTPSDLADATPPPATTTPATTSTNPPPTTTAAPAPAPAPASYLGFADAPPGQDFRPYSPTSPFNQQVPANPTLAPQSAAIVKTALANGVGSFYTSASPAKDYAHPIYYARTSDPLVMISSGSSALSGTRIHVPDLAQAAGGGDGHMSIVEPDGWEYDFWQWNHPAGSSTAKATTAYRQRYDGLGVVTPQLVAGDKTIGGTTASYFGLDAGMIRAPELAAGHINHALFLVISCGSSDTSFGFDELAPGANGRDGAGSAVYPAFKGDATCSGIRAPMGARFWLDLTDTQIDASGAPGWERTIAKAMHQYGGFMGDTGGPGFSFMLESSTEYTSLGRANAYEPIAKAAGIAKDATYGYVFRPSGKIAWATHLHVLPPG